MTGKVLYVLEAIQSFFRVPDKDLKIVLVLSGPNSSLLRKQSAKVYSVCSIQIQNIYVSVVIAVSIFSCMRQFRRRVSWFVFIFVLNLLICYTSVIAYMTFLSRQYGSLRLGMFDELKRRFGITSRFFFSLLLFGKDIWR